MKQKLLRYWLAMNASALQAGAHAVKAFMGLALAHSLSAGIPALNGKQLAAVFAFAFTYEIVNWLEAHPVTVLWPEDNAHQPVTPEVARRQDAGAPGATPQIVNHQ